MIQYQVKLRLSGNQKKKQREWLPILGSIFNFGIRKIELNARNKIYFTSNNFQNLLAGHGEKLGIPSHTIQGVLSCAYISWQRCFKGLARKPRLKGMRRPLNSIPFPDPIKAPCNGRIILPGLGKVRFHKQWIPEGKMAAKFWTALSILWGTWCLYGAIARGFGCWGLKRDDAKSGGCILIGLPAWAWLLARYVL